VARVIIAGSRSFTDIRYVKLAVKLTLERHPGLSITEVVSGKARGADTLGEWWAKKNSIPVKEMPAPWDDLTRPGAKIRTNAWGKKYNANAGFERNRDMAKYAADDPYGQGGLIALWDGESNGTLDMIEHAKAYNLWVEMFTKRLKAPE